MKKFLALTLTVCLCLGLGVTALAADLPEGWTPADGARGDLPEVVDVPIPAAFNATVTVDGKEVDTTGIPGAPAGYLPMRAIAEATIGGMAEWYPDDNEALFFLDSNRIIVNFTTRSVMVEFEPVEDVEVYLDPAGYTFLPVSLLNGMGDVVVDDNLELDVNRFDITTSASDPMNQVALSIMEAAEIGMGNKSSADDLEFMGIHKDNFTSIVAYLPMMIRADTVIIGEVAEGKLDAAKEDLEQRKADTIQNFEGYLPEPLEVAKGGQIVVAPDGAHIMLIISTNNDAAIELFNAAYPAAE